jgi:DNA polymerase/3'-5' exonuclease PolX
MNNVLSRGKFAFQGGAPPRGRVNDGLCRELEELKAI